MSHRPLIAELEEARTEVRLAIKDQMKALGIESVKTSFGTVSLTKTTRYNTQDWDSFKAFVLEHQVVDLLEKREELERKLKEAFGCWTVKLPDFVPKRDNKKLGYNAALEFTKQVNQHFDQAMGQGELKF